MNNINSVNPLKIGEAVLGLLEMISAEMLEMVFKCTSKLMAEFAALKQQNRDIQKSKANIEKSI